jgi:hypothetical protein
MESDKIDFLIKEIASKHGVAVGRDDPIMILQTINEKLMQESSASQQEILNRFKEELEDIANRWGDDAKNKAERTLNAALTASREAMTKLMQEGTQLAVKKMRNEMTVLRQQLSAPIRTAKKVSIMNLVAASMTILAAVLSLWVLIHIGSK